MCKSRRAHWTLYLERAAWVQKQRLYEQARAILVELEERRKIDSSPSQIVRTRAAVAARYSDLARAERNVRNAEVRLRMLVGDPAPYGGASPELVPVDQPCPEAVSIQLDQFRRTALQRRPEMNEAMKQVEVSTRRVDVARKDRLPSLDLILETYVAGLEGRGDIASALGNQFAVGEPGYTAGLRFEVPLNRRAASAQLHRCQLQLQEATSEMQTIALQVLSEVDLAAGEVETSRQEMLGKYYSMRAAQEEVQFLHERWHRLAGEDRSAAQFLDDLLDAQVRLALEQYSYCQAQVGHMMALVELKRTTGTLLQHANVVLPRGPSEPQRVFQHEQMLPATTGQTQGAGDAWEDVNVDAEPNR